MSNTYEIESERVTYNNKKGYIVKLFEQHDSTFVLVYTTFVASFAKLSESILMQRALMNYDSCDDEDVNYPSN